MIPMKIEAPSESVLARAAELRAYGSTWPAVASELDRSVTTVRRWPAMYPERWRVAVHQAERQIAAEAAGESLLILRQLLRSEDPKIRSQAARTLVRLRLELEKLDLRAAAQRVAAPASEAQRLVALLESHTDEQLTQMALDELGETAALPAPDSELPDRGEE